MLFEIVPFPLPQELIAEAERPLVHVRAGISSAEGAKGWSRYPADLMLFLEQLKIRRVGAAVLEFEPDDGLTFKTFLRGFGDTKENDGFLSWCRSLQQAHHALKFLALPLAVMVADELPAPLLETALHARRVYLRDASAVSSERLMSLGFPLGGGAKEVLLRAFEVTKEGGPFPYVRRAFFELMSAGASTAAGSRDGTDALLLRRCDRILEQREALLRRAVEESLYFMKGEAMPVRETSLPLPGESGRLQLLLEWREWAERPNSDPKLPLALALAGVFSGGLHDRAQVLNESALLNLEFKALSALWSDKRFRESLLD